MAEYPARWPSPAHVHERLFSRIGIRPCWQRQHYVGGRYWTEHFRTCSYCLSIHPEDLIDLLNAGGTLEETNKPGKFLLHTPNPIAGELIRMGSLPGHVFTRSTRSANLVTTLRLAHDPSLPFEPTINERLSGHFDRPAHEPAPAEIIWPFFDEHVHQRQWPEIWAAANNGEKNAQVQSAS